MRRLVYEIKATNGITTKETTSYDEAMNYKKNGMTVIERLDWVEEEPPKLTEKQLARRKKVSTKI